jgi:hypothetical protein
MKCALLAAALFLAAAPTAPIIAQRVDSVPSPAVRADSAMQGGSRSVQGGSHTLLRVSKWSTLAATVGVAVYGFSTNRTADKQFATLEELCVADREKCLSRNGEAYADADLEQRYQDVRTLDHRTRLALLGTQMGVVATVALFVLDLRHARPPRDIPYTPRALQLVPRGDGSLQLRLTLPLPVEQRQY